jgi:hypothetical protein
MITWPVSVVLVAFCAMVGYVGKRDQGAAFMMVAITVIAGCVIATH